MPASRVCYMSTCPFNVPQSTGGCSCWVTCNWFTDAPRVYTVTTGTSPIGYEMQDINTKTITKGDTGPWTDHSVINLQMEQEH